MCRVLCWNTIEYTCQSWPHHVELNDRFSTIRNDLLHEFINKAIVSFFATYFDRGLLQLVDNDIVNTLFKYWVSYRHLIFIIKTFELLMKSSAKFDWLFVNIQCAIVCSLDKVNFEMETAVSVEPLSYFNKIGRICCLNTHIQRLKLWLKSVLPWLKHIIFSRGLFFIGAPCMLYNCLEGISEC